MTADSILLTRKPNPESNRDEQCAICVGLRETWTDFPIVPIVLPFSSRFLLIADEVDFLQCIL